MAELLKQPVAWRREWDGDVSDEGHWLYTEDEAETKDGHTWQPLFLQPPTEEEIRAGLELFKRIRDESNAGVDGVGTTQGEVMSYASPEAVLAMQWNAAQEAQITEQARRAPHVLMRPRIFPDGTAWCALYGENIQEGVCGFGETPEAAAADFDLAWRQQSKRPAGVRGTFNDQGEKR